MKFVKQEHVAPTCVWGSAKSHPKMPPAGTLLHNDNCDFAYVVLQQGYDYWTRATDGAKMKRLLLIVMRFPRHSRKYRETTQTGRIRAWIKPTIITLSESWKLSEEYGGYRGAHLPRTS